jgi:hypothetical protein
MPWSFLNPWFWLGALAIAGPVWLHLKRRQESNLIRFSAVRFLGEFPTPRRSPLRLRDLLLFALRVLAVLLVVAAFTWPYLRDANTAPIKESRVYILDNTLSHQANDGFERDRARLLDELAKPDGQNQLAVIELTSMPRVVVSFSDDRQSARRRVAELEPSSARGPYLAAFRLADTLLANSLGQERRIILLGDNQENQWTENANSPPFLKGIEIELPRSPNRVLPNLSLSEPRVQRLFLGDKAMAHFTVRLTHIGDAKSATITLRTNGQVVLKRDVDLEKQPESILLQAQWEIPSSAWLRGEADVEGNPDALAGDNRVWFSLPPVVEGKVAVLAQSPYLRLALSPEIMRGEWASKMLSPTALPENGTEGDQDVLCIESSYLQSAEARALLHRYLNSGRGVVLFLNRMTPVIQEYLRELGFEAEPSGATGSAHEKIRFVSVNHPIFHPFLSPDYGNLTEIWVSDYVRLKGVQATPLMFSESGAGVFFQGTGSTRKLFVAAFPLDREHTSWPVHPTFIPFLDLTLQAARAEESTPTTFEPGEVAVVQPLANNTVREMVLRDGNRELARAPVDNGRAEIRMPERPGQYELYANDSQTLERVLSVNPSSKESQLSFNDEPLALKNWELKTGSKAVKSATPGVGKVRLAAILQQRLWWWMVMGGLLALMFEMALAGLRRERA